MNDQPTENSPKRRWYWIVRGAPVMLILGAALVLLAPWIVANTGLRDSAINAIVASPSVTASSESASFGWFSPMSVQGLRLKTKNKRIEIHVTEIASEETPFQLWSSSPELGTIRADKPHLQVQLPADLEFESSGRLEPTLTAIVKDAALTVHVPDLDTPAIDLDGIDMTCRVERTEEGRIFTLDPLILFDKRKLSPKLTGKLLHLIDPTIGDAPEIAGEISLALDKLRVPLGIPRDKLAAKVEAEGRLHFHEVASRVKSPMRQALVQLIAHMNDVEPSQVVRLVQDGEVRFQVRDGRLHHEGLRIGVPDLAPGLFVSSHGSVGLDQTLDLHVEIPRLNSKLRQKMPPAKGRVTGTISNPKISIQDAAFAIQRRDHREPFIAARGVDLNVAVEKTSSGRVLVFEPVDILKKEKLTLSVANGLVHLIEPELQGANDLAGEVSLSLQALRIPLGGAKEQMIQQLEAEGTLTLHQVSTQARSPMRQALVSLLADMYGKRATTAVRLGDNDAIHFKVRNGRLHHEGLCIGLPDIDPKLVVRSRGSIGLDETLDLHLELPRLRKSTKDKGPIQCHITGTVKHPKISLPDATLLVHLQGTKPTLAADNLRLEFGVEATREGRMLALAPVEVFTKRKLSPALAADLLYFVAPTLTDFNNLEGEVSLSVDSFRVPLGVPADQVARRVELTGKLHLHQISTDAKTPLLDAMVKVLATIHGKKASPKTRVVKNAEVRFFVRDSRIHHEGMRLGFPDIDPALIATSRGSVGLDKSLDLMLEVPRILVPGRISFDTRPVRLRVTGTVASPKVTEIKGEQAK